MKNKIALVRGIVPVVQIDFCDGVFVNTRTWPYSTGGNEDYYFRKIMDEEEGMPFWEDIDFELDLMVRDAVENFDIYMKLGPKRMVFHIEAVGDLEEFRNFVEGLDMYVRENVQIGAAIQIGTPTENIFPIVPHLDFVQCMGAESIGRQGQPSDDRVLEKIRTLAEKFPGLEISVDGGVNMETASDLVAAGATRLVVGSAIFRTDDIIGAIENLRDASEQ